MNDEIRDWLLAGDPSVRWQVMKDLLDSTPRDVQTVQNQVGEEGWGLQLLNLQEPDGRWTKPRGPNGYRGLYTPKWTSTTYTLLLLRRLGLPARHPGAMSGCDALVNGSQWLDDGTIAPWNTRRSDTCVNAMVLSILEWFDFDDTVRRDGLLEYLLSAQKSDGGWNCREDSEVSSVHTVISTLEALHIRRLRSPDTRIDDAMKLAHEYLLERRLMRSLRTGELIQKRFTMFSFPPRWYYDVLRGLDHFQQATDVADPRVGEAIELVRSKQRKDGTWTAQNKHTGEVHFELEKSRGPSRVNTLRALRVLKWWDASNL